MSSLPLSPSWALFPQATVSSDPYQIGTAQMEGKGSAKLGSSLMEEKTESMYERKRTPSTQGRR